MNYIELDIMSLIPIHKDGPSTEMSALVAMATSEQEECTLSRQRDENRSKNFISNSSCMKSMHQNLTPTHHFFQDQTFSPKQKLCESMCNSAL